MKKIIVREQPRLSLPRILRVTLDGIRYRLFRASVTVAVIGVAVAFLLNILSESLIKRNVARLTRERIQETGLVHDWVSRLTAPPGVEAILRSAAGAGRVPPAELIRMGGLDPAEAEGFLESASRFAAALDFFDGLDYAQRRRLVSVASGTEVFDRLAAPAVFAEFEVTLRRMPSVRLPEDLADLDGILSEWERVRRTAHRIRAGYESALRAVQAARGGLSVPLALADAGGAFGDAVRAAGFELDPDTATILARQAAERRDMRAIERTLDQREMRQVVARAYDILPGDVNMERVWRFLSHPDNAKTYLSVMRQNNLVEDERLDDERMTRIAHLWREQADLQRAERLTLGMDAGWMGLGDRMAWLLIVSLLVCGIGIANAMLMTVTERFREIATLKCLGALDGFIMVMFVLESVILGIVGGLLGGLLGGLIGTLRTLASLGAAFGAMVPTGDLVRGYGFSILMGVALAAMAAIYPAFRASRLAPMEAMRVE